MGLGLRGRVILRLCWPDGACSGDSESVTAVSHCQAAVGSVTPGGAVRRRARHRSGRILSLRGPVRYLATSDSERRDPRPRPCLSLRSLAGRYLPVPQKARQQWAHAGGCQCLRCRKEARSACMVLALSPAGRAIGSGRLRAATGRTLPVNYSRALRRPSREQQASTYYVIYGTGK